MTRNDSLATFYGIDIRREEMHGFDIMNENEFQELVDKSFLEILQQFRSNISNDSDMDSEQEVSLSMRACMQKNH